MNRESPDPTADARSDEILSGMREWRLQHPDATLTEIEQALDQRWYRLRTRMLEDLALDREAANWQANAVNRPNVSRLWPRARASRPSARASSKPMVATT